MGGLREGELADVVRIMEPRWSISRLAAFAGCILLFILLTENGLHLSGYSQLDEAGINAKSWTSAFQLFCVGAALACLTGTSSSDRAKQSFWRFCVGAGVVGMMVALLWRWHMKQIF